MVEGEGKEAGKMPGPEVIGLPGERIELFQKWIVPGGEDELSSLESGWLRRRLKRIVRKREEAITPDWCEREYDAISDAIDEGKVEEPEAVLYLTRFADKIEELERPERLEPGEEGEIDGITPLSRPAEAAPPPTQPPGPPQRRGFVPEFREGDSPLRWFRDVMGLLDTRDRPYEHTVNKEVIQAVETFIRNRPESERVRYEEEYRARRTSHDYSWIFRRKAKSVAEIVDPGQEIEMSHFNTLFRLPGVADAFREYERHGREVVTAAGTELKNIRREIANIAGSEWAQRIAEDIWYYTGRAARFEWTAGPGAKPDEEGRVETGGIDFMRRMFWMEAWMNRFNNGEPEIRPYCCDGARDFWSWSWRVEMRDREGRLRGGINAQIIDPNRRIEWEEIDYEKIRAGGEERREEEKRKGKSLFLFTKPMVNVPFEEIDFTRLGEDAYRRMIRDLANAEQMWMKVIAFAEEPSYERWKEVTGFSAYLSKEQWQAIHEQLLRGLIEFNIARVKLGPFALKGEHTGWSIGKERFEWTPYGSEDIYRVLEGARIAGKINPQQEKQLRREFGAGRVTKEIAEVMGDMPRALASAFGEFLKAIFS